MRVQRLITLLAVSATALAGIQPASAAAQEYQGSESYPLEARIWLDRGDEPVLQRGERARIYYRVSESAFVALFHIDTNGTTRLVFPTSPQENHYARGGRDYRVLFPGSSYWHVNDDPGMGYFFIVASPEPFDFRDLGYSHFAGGWDLSYVGQHVYGDPYLAMDDFVAALIPEWEYVAYGLDFTAYHVDRHHDYPRFLCYDCHGFRPFYSWNPYSYSCASFRVVIYNDPYYYPVTRYRGTRVVYVQPRRGVPHFAFKERAAGEAGTPQVVVRTTPGGSQPGVEGGERRRTAVPGGTSAVRGSGSASSGAASGSARARPGVEGSVPRRTGVGASGSAAQPPRASGVARPGASSAGRPVLERRPPATGSSTARPGTTRPGTRTTAPRPSSRVRRPGGGGTTGGSSPVVRSTGGSGTRSSPTVRSTGGSTSRTSPTVRSTGGSTSRTSPTVRSTGGSTSRTSPTVRSTGRSTSRTSPTVRSTGRSTSRTSPTVRSTGGSATRSAPKVRKPGGGGASKAPPRAAPKPTTRPKTRRPGGGGGGGPA